MADFARETLREAKAYAAKGEWRLAVQRCELIRSRARVPESVLVETWGILGVAHVGLASYEEALSFLKRAAPNDATIAAAERCFRELELSGDPRSIFERHAERQSKRSRRRWIGAIAALLSLPFVGCCGWLVYVIGDDYVASAAIQDAHEAGYAEGVQAGQGRSVAECVDLSTETLAECGPYQEAAAPCVLQSHAFLGGCLGAASGRDDYCAALPSSTDADQSVLNRCDGRAEPAYTACVQCMLLVQAWCEGQ